MRHERGVALTHDLAAYKNRSAKNCSCLFRIGDRKGIEEQSKVWDKIIVDRRAELAEWVEVLKTVDKRRIQILAFANNHFAGFGPGTIEQFRELWQRQVKEETKSSNAGTLFPV